MERYHCSREGAPKPFSKETGLEAEKHCNKKGEQLKARNAENHEEHDYSISKKHSDDVHVAVLPSGIKPQSSFDKNVSSEWMRNERILVNYRAKKLALQLLSLLA